MSGRCHNAGFSLSRAPSSQVVVNDSLLAYSKLSSGVFPDFNALARDIAAYAASGAVPPSWSTVK